MMVLGIETSCDETAVAIVENGKRVFSNVIASSADLHNKTGGVVPEVASREHVKIIIHVIKEAFKQAELTWEDIDLIAVTKGPGLVGSLLVGIETAKGLAFSKGKKIIGVNHIAGHIYSNWLEEDDEIKFPIITLTASGGHNHLVLVKDHFDFEILGKTRDDASGEAFDKIAKLLGLSYPGGPQIAKRAIDGDPNKFKFPRAWIDKNSLEFSFSGLKTAVAREVEGIEELNDKAINDVCASFQEAVTDVLAQKLIIAVKKYEACEIHLAGGVSANINLREKVKNLKEDLILRVPKKITYCTDNAAMVAAAAFFQSKKESNFSWRDLKVNPKFDL